MKTNSQIQIKGDYWKQIHKFKLRETVEIIIHQKSNEKNFRI